MIIQTDVGGKPVKFQMDDNASEQDIEDAITDMTPAPVEPPEPGIGRTLGLGARAVMEGVPGIVDLATMLPRTLVGYATGSVPPGLSDYMESNADILELPRPETPSERISSAVTSGLAGGGAGVGAFRALPGAAAKFMASSPAIQIGASGTGPLAGSVVGEIGGNKYQQMLASLAAGVGVPSAGSAALPALKRMASAATKTSEGRAGEIAQVIKDLNVDTSGLNAAAQNKLIEAVRKAKDVGGEIDPVALQRMADIVRIGGTPTRGTITMDPIQLTVEKNLAKQQAAAGKTEQGALPYAEEANNAAMKGYINSRGADTAQTGVGAGQQAMLPIQKRIAQTGDTQTKLYQNVKDADGKTADLDRAFFTQRMDELLVAENKNAYLPDAIKNQINDIAAGTTTVRGQAHPTPFNVNTIDQLKTDIAALQRRADGPTKRALTLVRQALDETPIVGESAEAMSKMNRARRYAKARFGWLDSSKGIKGTADNVAPDKFIEKNILGSNVSVRDAGKTVKEIVSSKDSMDQLKAYTLDTLKRKALGNNLEETATFSQAAYNKALANIGYDKLSLIFNKSEMDDIFALGRAANYMMVQPAGSAVNNSNSATTLLGSGLDQLISRFTNFPVVGPMVAAPMKNMAVNREASKALDMSRGITNAQSRYRLNPALLGWSVGDPNAPR